jgi:hypothetical protein
MTKQLHDALSDLVREVPEHVVRDDLADIAWAAGRRRRWRHRVFVAGAVAAVLAVVGPSILAAADRARTIQPAGSRGERVVNGYPQRIGHQWWRRELPDRPGPMAGIFVRSPEHPWGSSRDEWIAVSETGHQWLIPTAQDSGANAPTLSNTGRYLGYFPHYDRSPFVIHDLVSGHKTVLRNVSPHMSRSAHSIMVHVQTPAFWAPDDSRVLLFTVSGPPNDNVLLTPGGEVDHVRGGRFPAGWVGSDRLAFMEYVEQDNGAIKSATITVVDTSGAVDRRVRLDLPRAFRQTSSGMSQWSAATSPDGRSVAVLLDELAEASVYQFSLQDGRLLSGPAGVDGAADICPLGWRGAQPVVPTYPHDARGALAVLPGASPRALVVAEPGLGATCLMLASSAVQGEPHGGLLGTTTAWWSWWWREALLAGAAVMLIWVVRRTATRPGRDLRLLRARRAPAEIDS